MIQIVFFANFYLPKWSRGRLLKCGMSAAPRPLLTTILDHYRDTYRMKIEKSALKSPFQALHTDILT